MDAQEYRRASRDVWSAMAPGWDRRSAYFEQIARPVTERMLERLAPRAGETILDLAAGSGAVGLAAAALVGPGGRVIVSDFSEAMVEAARRNAARLGLANVECRVLDAERIALDDDAVDGVVCRWGYMLMADPAAALAETRRVLRPGGRLACAVFSGPEENPWAALPAGILVELGHMPPPERGGPGILALADPGRLSGLLGGAGFSEPRIDRVPLTWRFADAGDYWAYLTEAAGAIAMVLARLDDGERARVRALIAERATPFAGDDGLALPGVSLVVAAS
jgi:ubiquinone/menaquinone biosynthesis C-methylase UbiE